MSENTPGKKNGIIDKCNIYIKHLNRLYESEIFVKRVCELSPYVDKIDVKSFLNFQIIETTKKNKLLNKMKKDEKKNYTSNLYKLNTKYLNTDFFKKIVNDYNLKNKDTSPFWNEKCKKISDTLWMPKKKELEKVELNIFCNSINFSPQNLHYCNIKTINQYKDNLFDSIHQSEPINSEEDNIHLYTRKIRFYPSSIQKKYFQTYFGATRYLYNKTISLFKNKKKDDPFPLNLSFIRPLIMKNNSDLKEDDPEYWLKDVPYDTRQLAIKSAISSIKSSIELLKNKNIKKFNHKFKVKKDKRQIFFVDHRALKNLILFPSYLKDNSKLKVDNRYKNYEKYTSKKDSIILKDGEKYFILFTKEKHINKIDQKNQIISLDPGVNKFQSFYTPDKYCGELGNNLLKTKLNKILKKIDKLKSVSSQIKNKKKINNKCYKLITKVKNIINDFQWKISAFLTKNYKNLLLPSFNTKKMKSTLDSKTNRFIDIYSHYKFKKKIFYQCEKYGTNLKIVDESYTTKTCGNCGCMNHFVGRSNVFWCPYCKIELERDYQAARNILLKNN